MRRFYRLVLLASVLVAIGSVATHEMANAATANIQLGVVANTGACATVDPATFGAASVPYNTSVALCALVKDATSGAPVASAPVTFTVSIGLVSTGTAKTVTAFTDSNGRATTNYRSGTGLIGGATDTAIASNTTYNAVGTVSITITGGPTPTPTPVVTPAPTPTAPQGGVGSTRVAFITGGSCVSAAFAATSNATIVPSSTGTFCAQPVDANGVAAGPGQVLLLTTSAGRLAIGGGSGATSITATTDSNGIVSGSYAAPSTPGLDNLIAQNVTTTQTNGLVTLTVGSGSSSTPTTVPTSTTTATPTVTTTATATPPPGGVPGFDITASATPITSVTNPGGYGREISVIRDGNYPTSAGSGSPVVFDTFRPGPPDLETWIGHQFASTQLFRGLQYQEGNHYPDGGWWNSMRVQVRSGGTWSDVSSQFVQPSYPAGAGPGFATYVLTFSPVSGDGIRLFGTPGGTATFVSIAELRVYGDQTSTTPVPPPAQTSGAGTITAGTRPPANGGFSVFVFGGGTNAQLASAAGCAPGQGVFWVTNAGGEFVTYVVGTQISAVNALWNSMFANGIPANQPMIGTCR